MGEALSFPEGAEGDRDGLSSPPGSAGVVPNEGVLLSQLIQLLSQRPRHTLLLSDLGALMPGSIRQKVKDQGGLRVWLQRYPSLFELSGSPGKEGVTLILGAPAKLEVGALATATDPGEDLATRSIAP